CARDADRGSVLW
nr:immunoglobulin heavy chain junction region [Macaca mulatta]